MHWSDPFVGLPYADRGRSWDGVDCWGLVWLVYREVLRVELPSYSDRYSTASDRAEVEALIGGERLTDWTPVSPEREFDVVLMREARMASHVGLVVRPGWMLHMPGSGASVLEQYTTGRHAHRVVGIFRNGPVANGTDRKGSSAG